MAPMEIQRAGLEPDKLLYRTECEPTQADRLFVNWLQDELNEGRAWMFAGSSMRLGATEADPVFWVVESPYIPS